MLEESIVLETIQLLQNTFTATNKEIREQSEIRLKELEKNLLPHLKVLLNCLRPDSTFPSKILLLT